jgi:hypothetical protein
MVLKVELTMLTLVLTLELKVGLRELTMLLKEELTMLAMVLTVELTVGLKDLTMVRELTVGLMVELTTAHVSARDGAYIAVPVALRPSLRGDLAWSDTANGRGGWHEQAAALSV